MKQQKSFEDILKARLAEHFSSPAQTPRPTSTTQDWGFTMRAKVFFAHPKKAYAVRRKKPHKKLKTEAKPQVIEAKLPNLTPNQTLSMEIMNRLGAKIELKNLTKKEVKKAFRTLALRYHPDRYHNRKPHFQEEARIKFEEIRECYHSLLEVFTTEAYDTLAA